MLAELIKGARKVDNVEEAVIQECARIAGKYQRREVVNQLPYQKPEQRGASFAFLRQLRLGN